jgi:hypothetical protein
LKQGAACDWIFASQSALERETSSLELIPMRFQSFTLVAPIALLAACTVNPDAEDADGAMDPASEQALNEDLMTDADLAGSNEANAALSGSSDSALPTINTSPEAIAAARSRAAELVGGADSLKPAPAPTPLSSTDIGTPAMRQAAQAAISPGGASCGEKVEYTTSWAAKLPETFPVYPSAGTVEAAGTDEGACMLRVVTFRSPVPLSDVLAFYHTRASGNGYSAEHVRSGGDNILSGVKGKSAYVVYGRRLPSGMTEIDLVTSAQ